MSTMLNWGGVYVDDETPEDGDIHLRLIAECGLYEAVHEADIEETTHYGRAWAGLTGSARTQAMAFAGTE